MSDEQALRELLAQKPRKIKVNRDEMIRLMATRVKEHGDWMQRLTEAHNTSVKAIDALTRRVAELERQLGIGGGS